jgi:hypothetical protein
MLPFQEAPDSQSSTLNASNTPAHGEPSSADHGIVRSIPPWVLAQDDSDDDDDDDSINHTRRLLPLANTVPATHHYLPAPPTQHKAPGRKWDHIRSAEPPLLDQPISANQQRWLPYMLSGPQPRGIPGARLVSDAWMDENMPHLTTTWSAIEPEKAAEKQKGLWLFTPARRSQTFARIKVSSQTCTRLDFTSHLIPLSSVLFSRIPLSLLSFAFLSSLLPWLHLDWALECFIRPMPSTARVRRLVASVPRHTCPSSWIALRCLILAT